MRHFEDVPEEKDNLGNNPEFIALEDLAEDTNLRPDEILMLKEEEEKNTPENIVDIDDVNNEPSNWEGDVEDGKYDEFNIQEKPIREDIETNPISLRERQNIVGIEEMKGRERLEKYWDASAQDDNNSKPKRDQDNRDSIRFDDAV
jgi:hypothetical protein